MTGRTNVVAYDWGKSMVRELSTGSISRSIPALHALYKAQIPPKSASFAWLNAMAKIMGNSVTIVTQTGPNQLMFGRKSDLGLNSAELDLLADWLESPQFPKGLNTILHGDARRRCRRKRGFPITSRTNFHPRGLHHARRRH